MESETHPKIMTAFLEAILLFWQKLRNSAEDKVLDNIHSCIVLL